MFHFAFARLGAASLWIDYVPSESYPADDPSRFHEMTAAELTAARAYLGTFTPSAVPEFTDANVKWLAYADIARSVWQL